jgi:DNA polymerase-3 subunit chi
MTDVWFYHLETRALEDVLPTLVERTLAYPWRALIRADCAERAEAIDNLLWTWREDSFLPHGRMGQDDPAAQPVLITTEEGNPNRADVVFFVGGSLPRAWDEGTAELARIIILFDGRDATALAAARNSWSAAKTFGHDVTYWKQSTGGKWEKHA